MRIAHVVENLDRGGLEMMVITLISEQITQGHQCCLICLFEEGEMAQTLRDKGIDILACGKNDGFDLASIKLIRNFLVHYKPEVLHTHNPTPHYYAVFASRRLGIRKIINTRHGRGRKDTSIKQKLLFRLATLYSNYCIAVCKTSLKQLVSSHAIPKAKSLVINNGICLDKRIKKSEEKKRALLKRCNLSGNYNIICTVGRLEPVKNHMMLLRAFNEIKESDSTAILIIIGSGSEESTLKRFADDLNLSQSVMFLGPCDNVSELLAGCDLFVLTSTTEGYSMALLEACAANLPIVATDVGGNHEIVTHGVNGRLVPSNDHMTLATTINELLSSEEIMRKMGDAGRAWIENNATIEIMAIKYNQLYA